MNQATGNGSRRNIGGVLGAFAAALLFAASIIQPEVANADQGGIILDLKKLNRVRSVDKKSLTCVVEAGKICKEFEAELNEDGYSFTHYPASTEWATIGGARAFMMEDRIGTLSPGKKADIVMLRAHDINMAPVYDPVYSIVEIAGPGNVDTVIIDGVVRKKDGKLTVPAEVLNHRP